MATSTPVEEPRPFVAVIAIPLKLKMHQIIETPEVFEFLCVRHTAIFARVGPGAATTKRHIYTVTMDVEQRFYTPTAIAAARYLGSMTSPNGLVHHMFLGEE